MSKNLLIRLSLMLIVHDVAENNSMGQQPVVMREITLPSSAEPGEPQSGLRPSGQVQQPQPGQLPPYYAYPYGSETTTSRMLSAQEAVALALEHAVSLKEAQFEEQSAVQDVKQARVALFPEFSAPLTYVGTTPSPIREPGEPRTFSYVSEDAINHSIAFMGMNGTIDIAGTLRAALRRSRALLAAAHAGTVAARRNLVIATIDAYYGLVLTRQRRRLADEALALAESFVAVTEEQRKRGTGEETDVLRAQSAARSRRDELAQAQLNESIAMSQLRILTGLDYTTYITVARITEDVPQIADLLGYQEDAIMSRPELAQLEFQKRAASEEARAARRELRPQLTYALNGGFDAADFKPLSRYSGGSATVSLNIPIFNFGASKSRAAQAQIRARSFDAQRASEVLQLKQEFYAARAGALSAWDRSVLHAGRDRRTAELAFDFWAVPFKECQLAGSDRCPVELFGDAAGVLPGDCRLPFARARLEVDPMQMFRANRLPPLSNLTLKFHRPAALGVSKPQRLTDSIWRITESQMKELVPGIQYYSS